MTAPVIVLFRRDLRLSDNPALYEAVAAGRPVLPLYIDAGDADACRPLGSAARWWLRHSLAALDAELQRRGSYLTVRTGAPHRILPDVVRETGAAAVYWEPGREPHERAAKRTLAADLTRMGCAVHAGRGNVLFTPCRIRTKAGDRFRVFTPFWRACRAAAPPEQPLPAPASIDSPRLKPASDPLPECDDAKVAARLDMQLGTMWRPGEAGAFRRLEAFCERGLGRYAVDRDAVGDDATTRLSPHLAFGEISARQIWHAALDNAERHAITQRGMMSLDAGVEALQRELAWREFAAHLLALEPAMAERPLRTEFVHFPWEMETHVYDEWKAGRTGFPLVDAGMRELHATGFMHNRVRMVAASFLVKDGLIPWQLGEGYFWDRLVDADLANNAANWQWVAGCGADAAPYFRIFNPTLQARKYDPEGTYIRRWIPELRSLPTTYVHNPAEAPAETLREAGIALGREYPRPIVDHRMARERALQAFAALRS